MNKHNNRQIDRQKLDRQKKNKNRYTNHIDPKKIVSTEKMCCKKKSREKK